MNDVVTHDINSLCQALKQTRQDGQSITLDVIIFAVPDISTPAPRWQIYLEAKSSVVHAHQGRTYYCTDVNLAASTYFILLRLSAIFFALL